MTHHKSYLRMTHEYDASRKAYEKATRIMCSKVSIPVSDRYNSLYGERDLHHALIALSISNGYAESGMRRLAIETGASVPSGSWVRDRVAGVGERDGSEARARPQLDPRRGEIIQGFQLRSSPRWP